MGKGPVGRTSDMFTVTAILNAGLTQSVIEEWINSNPAYADLQHKVPYLEFLQDYLREEWGFPEYGFVSRWSYKEAFEMYRDVYLADGIRDYVANVVIPDEFPGRGETSVEERVAEIVKWDLPDDADYNGYSPVNPYFGPQDLFYEYEMGTCEVEGRIVFSHIDWLVVESSKPYMNTTFHVINRKTSRIHLDVENFRTLGKGLCVGIVPYTDNEVMIFNLDTVISDYSVLKDGEYLYVASPQD